MVATKLLAVIASISSNSAIASEAAGRITKSSNPDEEIAQLKSTLAAVTSQLEALRVIVSAEADTHAELSDQDASDFCLRFKAILSTTPTILLMTVYNQEYVSSIAQHLRPLVVRCLESEYDVRELPIPTFIY